VKKWLMTLGCLLLLPALAVGQSTQRTGTIGTNGDCVTLGSLGVSNGTVSLTGTWTGTISFTAQIGTAAFDTLPLTPLAGGAEVTAVTANGRWTFGKAYTTVQACATATVTGTAVVNLLIVAAGQGGAGGGAVTQSGTWTVQPGNTANTTAWKVDGSAVTQPVAGTGTAGSAAGGVLTVQGQASMTKLLVTPDSVALPANQSVQARQATTGAVVADLAVTTGSQAVVASAATRLGIICWNQGASPNAIRLGFGATPTSTTGFFLAWGTGFTDTGTYAINAIRDTAATGNPTLSCSTVSQ